MTTEKMLWQEKAVSVILWFRLPKKQGQRTTGKDQKENRARQETEENATKQVLILINSERGSTSVYRKEVQDTMKRSSHQG